VWRDGVVLAVVGDVVVADLAEVDGVAEQPQDGLAGPQVAGAGAPAGVVEPVGDGLGAEAFVDVLGEDGLHDGGLVGVDGQGLAGRVQVVAVGGGTAEPFAAGGFAFEAGGDAVDEQAAFERGEDAEQLQQHPPDGALGVDGLGGRREGHACGFELFHDGHEPDDGAGEPVDAVHEQHVERAGAGGVEGLLEAGPVEGGAGGLVDEAVGDRHRRLGGDELFEAVSLRFEGVGLVDLVG
jgi:hypothetical protein